MFQTDSLGVIGWIHISKKRLPGNISLQNSQVTSANAEKHIDKPCLLSSSDSRPIKCTKEACDRLRENVCVDSNKAVSCLCGNQYDCSGVNITGDFVNNCAIFRGVGKRRRSSK